VSRARFTPTAEFNAGVHGRHFFRAALLSTLVAAATLTVVLVPRPAAADQIGDLKAQAKEISQQLIQEQLQIGAYQQQYSVASVRVAADARAVAQIGNEIGQDKRRIAKATNVVRQLAIESYMDAGASLSGSDEVFSGNAEKAELANEYSTISAGNIDTALDRFHAAQHVLQSQEVTLEQAQSKDQADAAQQATDLGQATQTEHQMESEQAEVTGHLAEVVAQQAAAQAAAAAAAVAAAQRAAAQRAAAQAAVVRVTATPGSTFVGAGEPSADPVLPPYLQCVLQAESGGNYAAVSANGLYMGGFQFSQATWNMAAPAAGLPNLVGVPPNLASPAGQDDVAIALYSLDGKQPWLGDRCS
jgi:peptidoglycan hydrolase CwlO-like protein